MKTLHEIVNQQLVWIRPSQEKSEYVLRSGAEVFATLHRKSTPGLLAHAEARDGTWTFKRGGVFYPRVIIRAGESGDEVASFTLNWRSNVLNLPGQRSFGWSNRRPGYGQWVWADDAGEPLVFFRLSYTQTREEGTAEITEAAGSIPELSLLLLLGWYLVIVLAEDSGLAEAPGAETAIA
jgi:hypothetical protein